MSIGGYFTFEKEVWLHAWRATFALLSLEKKHAPAYFVGALLGFGVLAVSAGPDVVSEELLVAISMLSGVGLLFFFVFMWQLSTAPYKLWRARGARIEELTKDLPKVYDFQIDISQITFGITDSGPGGGIICRVLNKGQRPSVLVDWWGELYRPDGSKVNISLHAFSTFKMSGGPTGSEDTQFEGTSAQSIIERAVVPIVEGGYISGVILYLMELNDQEKSLMNEAIKRKQISFGGGRVTLSCRDVQGNIHTGSAPIHGGAAQLKFLPGIL